METVEYDIIETPADAAGIKNALDACADKGWRVTCAIPIKPKGDGLAMVFLIEHPRKRKAGNLLPTNI